MKTAFRPFLALALVAPAVALARIPARPHAMPDADSGREPPVAQPAPVVGDPPVAPGVVLGVWTVPATPWYPPLPDPVPMRMPAPPEPRTPECEIRRLFGGS